MTMFFFSTIWANRHLVQYLLQLILQLILNPTNIWSTRDKFWSMLRVISWRMCIFVSYSNLTIVCKLRAQLRHSSSGSKPKASCQGRCRVSCNRPRWVGMLVPHNAVMLLLLLCTQNVHKATSTPLHSFTRWPSQLLHTHHVLSKLRTTQATLTILQFKIKFMDYFRGISSCRTAGIL